MKKVLKGRVITTIQCSDRVIGRSRRNKKADCRHIKVSKAFRNNLEALLFKRRKYDDKPDRQTYTKTP